MSSSANSPIHSLDSIFLTGLVGVTGLAALAAVAYAGTCLALYNYQRKLIFLPQGTLFQTPADVGLAYEDVWIPLTGAGRHTGMLHGWWLPNPSASPKRDRTLLFFHGNYGNIGHNIERIRFFHSLGFSVLTIDYRGYGQSKGGDAQGQAPTEETTYVDADAAWNYLVSERRIQPESIMVCGHSLGGAIAINLAIQQPRMAGLIVKSSFTTMKDAVYAKQLYRLFPIEQLLTEPGASKCWGSACAQKKGMRS